MVAPDPQATPSPAEGFGLSGQGRPPERAWEMFEKGHSSP